MLIDNHITDLNPKFMSKFDPEQYVAMVRRAGVKSAMVYSCDHNGNCYYPTRVGHMHAIFTGGTSSVKPSGCSAKPESFRSPTTRRSFTTIRRKTTPNGGRATSTASTTTGGTTTAARTSRDFSRSRWSSSPKSPVIRSPASSST
ncbi:MAG: hypothetical protein L6W00_29375 [Lentisphaeria bacterium]|nr:MAG: hypothetical protein L6W00_29375 [Lentisphaeria bacterium]